MLGWGYVPPPRFDLAAKPQQFTTAINTRERTVYSAYGWLPFPAKKDGHVPCTRCVSYRVPKELDRKRRRTATNKKKMKTKKRVVEERERERERDR